MSLDYYSREKIADTLRAVTLSWGTLTADERKLLAAIAAGFGLTIEQLFPIRREERQPRLPEMDTDA